jgi:hypothetical protein
MSDNTYTDPLDNELTPLNTPAVEDEDIRSLQDGSPEPDAEDSLPDSFSVGGKEFEVQLPLSGTHMSKILQIAQLFGMRMAQIETEAKEWYAEEVRIRSVIFTAELIADNAHVAQAAKDLDRARVELVAESEAKNEENEIQGIEDRIEIPAEWRKSVKQLVGESEYGVYVYYVAPTDDEHTEWVGNRMLSSLSEEMWHILAVVSCPRGKMVTARKVGRLDRMVKERAADLEGLANGDELVRLMHLSMEFISGLNPGKG